MRSLAVLLVLLLPIQAEIIGISKPAQSLTEARVMTIPEAQREPWLDYLHRSEQQMLADKASLAAERSGLTEVPPLPKQDSSARSIPLDQNREFYQTELARHIGHVILSFQTPAGGWSKNLDMKGAERQRGQAYATANLAPVASGPADFDEPHDPTWHYVGTLDNDATNAEMHFLAALSAALPGKSGDAYRKSFLRGLHYLLDSQFPNGGWPQVWPLEGGYHDAITFNDNAVTESSEILTLAAEGQSVRQESGFNEDYSYVPMELRVKAASAAAKALDCIFATQVRVRSGNGRALAVWSQQNDPLTLEPVSARNFEPAALSSGESASVMEYLMSLSHPSIEVVRSVRSAAAWFRANEIMGYTWSGVRATPGGRKLIAVPGAGPIWARYYSLTSGKPIFGDRDKTIHNDVKDLSMERRNGYAWYGSSPEKALAEYAAWASKHPL